MTIIKTLTVASLLSLNLVACNGQAQEQEANVATYQNAVTDPTPATTLTITKVKKPWYAWRGLIVKKMRESIPEYQSIKGLQQKFYSFTEDHKLFGGIYLWQTEKDATNWFSQTWYDRTEEKYGIKGSVDYYKVESVNSFADIALQESKYCSVLTHSSIIGIDISTKGILKEIHLKNAKEETFYLTIWKDKTSAENFFKDKDLKNHYFDNPIFINNNK